MASTKAPNHILVDSADSLKDIISELKQSLERNTVLAVDCEGVSLSRKGTLTIVTVALPEKAYIFDVLKLGQATFNSGLGEILEDKSREKLMFDCREDSDALWHQFHVKLTGVLDLQLLEVIFRREMDGTAVSMAANKNKRRSQRTNEVERLHGFLCCLELYVKDEGWIKTKEKGTKLLRSDVELWKKRPLSKKLVEYCVVDTVAMFSLYEKMKDVNGGEKARLCVASERYVDFYRGRSDRKYNRDNYEKNAFLPLDIIPEKGNLGFPYADTQCTCCSRKFPREEFSKTQLRAGEQKCRVCKEMR